MGQDGGCARCVASGAAVPVVSAGLVGRVAEVARLRDLAAGVAAGRGGAVWVEGEPGIGKSSVLAAGLAGAAATVRWGSCDELGQRLPLRVLTASLGIEESAPDPDLAAVANLLNRGAAAGGWRVDAVATAVAWVVGLGWSRGGCAAVGVGPRRRAVGGRGDPAGGRRAGAVGRAVAGAACGGGAAGAAAGGGAGGTAGGDRPGRVRASAGSAAGRGGRRAGRPAGRRPARPGAAGGDRRGRRQPAVRAGAGGRAGA